MLKTLCLLCLLAAMPTARSQTPEQKKIATDETKVSDAAAGLREAQAILKQDYPAFRADTKKRIEDNNTKVKALRASLIRPLSSPLNDSIKRRIEELSDRNYEDHSILDTSPK
jgi:hypothetical protein